MLNLIPINNVYDWNKTDNYQIETFFELINDVVDNHFYGFTHPLGRKLMDGKFSLEELRFLAVQEYQYFLTSTWWNAYKIAHCDNLDQQRFLHNPLLDELGTDLIDNNGNPAHSELFLLYCKGLGLSRTNVENAYIVPSVVIAVTELLRIAKERPHFEFIACSNLVIERMRPLHYKRLLDVFKESYSFVPKESLLFFEIHAKHDIDHTSIGKELVKRYVLCKRDQDAVFSAVLRSICVRQVMYDGIFAAMQNKESFGLKLWPNFPHEPWPRPTGGTLWSK